MHVLLAQKKWQERRQGDTGRADDCRLGSRIRRQTRMNDDHTKYFHKTSSADLALLKTTPVERRKQKLTYDRLHCQDSSISSLLPTRHVIVLLMTALFPLA